MTVLVDCQRGLIVGLGLGVLLFFRRRNFDIFLGKIYYVYDVHSLSYFFSLIVLANTTIQYRDFYTSAFDSFIVVLG